MSTATVTTWRIEVAGCGWLTSNQRLNRYTHAAAVKAWRAATEAGCRQAKLPKGITPVSIELVIHYASARPPVRDSPNLYPTVKAIIDGLGPARGRSPGYGFLPDDSDRHIPVAPTWTMRKASRPYVEVLITQLGATRSDHVPTPVPVSVACVIPRTAKRLGYRWVAMCESCRRAIIRPTDDDAWTHREEAGHD